MAEIVFTGKPRMELVLFSHLGITEKDEDKIGIAKNILAKYGNLALTTLDTDDGQEEYCFTTNEFPPAPAWRKAEGFLQGIDIIDMATEEFFGVVPIREKRIKMVLISHLGITDKDTPEVEIAKRVAKKNGAIRLAIFTSEDDSEEYCYVLDEFSPEPVREEGKLVMQKVDVVGTATKEFFQKVKKI